MIEDKEIPFCFDDITYQQNFDLIDGFASAKRGSIRVLLTLLLKL